MDAGQAGTIARSVRDCRRRAGLQKYLSLEAENVDKKRVTEAEYQL